MRAQSRQQHLEPKSSFGGFVLTTRLHYVHCTDALMKLELTSISDVNSDWHSSLQLSVNLGMKLDCELSVIITVIVPSEFGS